VTMQPCYLKTIIAKIAAPFANRLRLLQWSWCFQLFATRRLTIGTDTELYKYRAGPRKEFATDDFLSGYLG
jgi:hypothetical protein